MINLELVTGYWQGFDYQCERRFGWRPLRWIEEKEVLTVLLFSMIMT